MNSLVKNVLFKYHTLLIKMALDAPTIAFAKSNLCLLTCENIVGIEYHYASIGW
jgi:hypothetical protein